MSALYRTLTGQSQKSSQTEQSVSQPAAPSLTRTTTTDPLTGTLNHLNPAQEHKLVEFKQKLEKDGWWSPNGANGKATHDDGTLLRYLRARKFDVQGAIGQFTDTEKWMKEQKVEELYDNFDVDIYERSRLLYPQWTGHRDKRGIPIYVYVIKAIDSKHVSKYQKESQSYKNSLPSHKKIDTPAKLMPLFALYQNLLTFVLPLVSTLERPNPEVPVTNSTNIVDISGVGLTQFWNLKAHMQDASVLATAHYPETLDRIFIIGAPNFFPTVWGWIKRWFDPVTVSKIFILGKNEVKPTLSKFMDIKDFPVKYGGELKWEPGDMPHMDAETLAAIEKDGKKGWVRGPCYWLDGKRVVVGSEGGKLRRSAPNVEEMKPVVYAADYTEHPVHQDRKASGGSSIRNGAAANGTASAHHAAEGAAVTAAVGGATGANLIAAQTNAQHQPEPAPAPTPTHAASQPSEATAPAPQPGAQPVAPPTTAAEPQVTSMPPPPQPGAVPSIPTETAAPNSSLLSAATYAHPPSQPQPGPISTHAEAMTTAIQNKLEGESVSVIPPSANGHIGLEGTPEVIVASDQSKGLAIEAEKLKISEQGHEGAKTNGVQRPPIERFVTALEG